MKKAYLAAIFVGVCSVLIFVGLTARAVPVADSQKRFDVDLKQLLMVIGAEDVRVLTDQRYTLDKDLAPPVMIRKARLEGRRIVVMCRVPKNEQSNARGRFEEELDRLLQECGAIQKGEESVSHAGHYVVEDKSVSTDINAPRMYFAIGRNYGMIDAGLYAHEGQVFINISYLQ